MNASTPGNRTDETNIVFSRDTKFVVAILLALFFAGSLIGNSLVIAVVYKNVNKKMRTTINLFVVNMAVSDLLTIVFSFPISFWAILTSLKRPNPDISTVDLVICKVQTQLWFASSSVSLLSLVAIALDRFWAVFFPTKRPLTSRKPSVVFIAIWLFCIGLAMFPTLTQRCSTKLNSFYIEFLYLYILWYMGMTIIAIFVLYPAILIKLWRRQIPGNPSSANQELRDRTNRKVTVMAIVLIISFSVCWFPYFGVLIAYLVTESNDNHVNLHKETIIVMLLTYSSCVWNPLVCTVLNSNFRAGSKMILQTLYSCFCVTVCNVRKKNEISNLSSSTVDQFGQERFHVQLTCINNLKRV